MWFVSLSHDQGLLENCEPLEMNVIQPYSGLGKTAKRRGQEKGR